MQDPPPAASILLIEDDAGDVRLIEEFIADFGKDAFALEHAPTLDEGLKRLGRGAVDAVLVDMNLPAA